MLIVAMGGTFHDYPAGYEESTFAQCQMVAFTLSFAVLALLIAQRSVFTPNNVTAATHLLFVVLSGVTVARRRRHQHVASTAAASAFAR